MKEEDLTLTIKIPLAAFTAKGVDVELLNCALREMLTVPGHGRLCFMGELFEHTIQRLRDHLMPWHRLPESALFAFANIAGKTLRAEASVTLN